MAGAGAAAAGVAAVGSTAVGSTAGHGSPAHKGTPVEGTLVAQVKDVKSGRITVMVEGREVVVTDHELVAHLTSKLA